MEKENKDFSVCVDWLQCLMVLPDFAEFEYLQALIQDLFIDEWITDEDRPMYKGRSFTHSQRTINSTCLAWNITDDGIDCWLSITGSTLSGGTEAHLKDFIRYLVSKQSRFTRIDLALDDFTKSLKPDYFKTAYQRGHHHGFRKMDYIQSFDSPDPDQEQGFTVYMGKRTGNKVVRYYNKSVESLGKIDSHRIEVEYKDDYCSNVIEYLFADRFSTSITNLITSSIDFTDLEGVRLLWWEAFLQRVSANHIHLSCGRQTPSIESSMKWIEHQVETTLSVIEEFSKRISFSFPAWIENRLESGRQRMKSTHRGLISEAVRLYQSKPIPVPISEINKGEWF